VTLKDIAEILEATIIGKPEHSDLQIHNACSADMMSAVLYYHTPNSLLLTGLNQPQVIRTADIAGITSVVFVLGKEPDDKTLEFAREKNIPLLVTEYCMYTASGRLYKAGLPGCLNK
jgi:predicted transcriptional regulator